MFDFWAVHKTVFLLYKKHQTKLGHLVQGANTFRTGGCQKTILGAIA